MVLQAGMLVKTASANGKPSLQGYVLTPSPKRAWTLSWSELWDTYVATDACEGHVRSSYIDRNRSKNDVFFLQWYETVESGRRGRAITNIVPAAFALCRIDAPKNELYVDVICSRPKTAEHPDHSAGHLLRMAEGFAKDIGLGALALNALPTVFSFYARAGFKHRERCCTPAVEDIDPRFRRIMNELERRAKAGKLPRNLPSAYDDKDLLDAMKLLNDRGLGAKKSRPECDPKKTDRHGLKTNRCGDEGFEMRRCW